jgi:hypothetical protein
MWMNWLADTIPDLLVKSKQKLDPVGVELLFYFTLSTSRAKASGRSLAIVARTLRSS